ncbi:MAG: restriction endonuclease subunit S [Muribaculum sp.]|nr:restriction endonuclease subunit S [Muribaculum sp.]
MSKPLIPDIRFKGYDDEWNLSTVSENFNLYSGTTPSRSNPDAFLGNINWISSGELKNHYIGETQEKISQSAFDKSSLKIIPPGLLVIAIYGLEAAGVRGTASITTLPTTISQACNCFIPKGSVTTEFLYGWYKHHGDYIGKNLAQGSKQQNLKSEIIGELSLSFPNREEQIQIGTFFSDIDKLITQIESELDRLEKMKLASLQKMFPRPGTTTPEIRFAGFTGEWAVKKIGEIFSEGNARGCSGTPLSVSIARGVYPTEDFVKTVTVKDFSNYKLVDEGDIVYNSMRMWQGASGVSYWNGFVSPAYTVLRPREEEHICSEFFTYLFKLDWVIKIFEANSQGLTKDTWNLKYPAISQIELPIPSDEKEQIQIAEYFRSLDALIVAKREKLAKLRNIKKSCLDKMFVNTSDL